jgi:phosphopantothenoylcysteine decarboxylase/phosphopantothenate--cysteine ligase
MPREILIGVTGGVAAFKAAALVSDLVQGGEGREPLGVTVVMTQAATQFVGEATFRALTGRRVATQVFETDDHPLGPHIELARQAELLCVAPASANFLAKAASGLADDLLSTLYLSFTGPVVVAPAMNCEMWAKPAVARNVEQLRADGVHVVDPQEGWLSCRVRGIGRMAEPAEIARVVHRLLKS